jgi:hypothetical protein
VRLFWSSATNSLTRGAKSVSSLEAETWFAKPLFARAAATSRAV